MGPTFPNDGLSIKPGAVQTVRIRCSTSRKVSRRASSKLLRLAISRQAELSEPGDFA